MKRLIILAMMAVAAMTAMAQVGAPAVVGSDVVKLPNDTKNLSIVDGKLYGSSAGILLGATYRNGKIVNFDAALEMKNISSRMDYIVRNPETGVLYYTRTSKKGESMLYEYDTTGKKPTSRQVKLGKYNVYHPTFSKDGSIMVFASPDGLGFGGMDLWYTRQVDGEWEEPRNFGHKVNGPFDETAPCMYGDYLVFASTGREVGEADTVAGPGRLYVARLMSSRQLGDTVMRFPIGKAPVQTLPHPYNGKEESLEMAVDRTAGQAYWIVRSGNEVLLYGMKGSLSGALAEGYVQDREHRALADVKVMAYDAKGSYLIGSDKTDENGYYSIMLNVDADYMLKAETEGFFESVSMLTTTRGNQSPDIMITEHHVDFELEKMDLDRPYSLGSIFGPQADVDLSETGEEALMKLVAYMKSNSGLKSRWTIWSRFPNGQFSQMVTDQRIATLKDFLEKRGVKGNRVSFVNGDAHQLKTDDAEEGSRCEVVLSK